MKFLCLPQSRPVGSEKRSCWIQEGISRPAPTLTVKQLGMAGPSEATRYADDIRSAGHVMEEVFRRKPYLQFLRGKSSPDFSLLEARDGCLIPAEHGKALCTAYGPAREADRILTGAQGLKRTQILVILGAGNPEIFKVAASLVPGQICAVLDHRLALGGYYIQTLESTSRNQTTSASVPTGGEMADRQSREDKKPATSPPDASASASEVGSGDAVTREGSSEGTNPEPTITQGEDSKFTSSDSLSIEESPISAPGDSAPSKHLKRNPHPFRELQTYLGTAGCHLFFGEETLISLEHYLEGLPAENFQGIRFLKHRSSVDQAPDFYEYAEARMRAILQSRMSDLLPRFEFEPLWLRNTLLNSREARPETEPRNLIYWKDRWKDKPALLVSAGPSLSESLEWIRSHQDQFFILACDTALKPLLRAGIRPHGAHILDAQKQTLLHFLNEDLSDLVLFADLVCHPSLPRHLKPGGWVFSSTARLIYRPDGSTEELKTPGTDLLESMCGFQGRLQSGGSVATSAFDLLRFLGFRSIYFAGQDLAWTFRQLHALSTHHYERWNYMVHRRLSLESINERVMQKRDLVPVPSVDGKSIPGDFILSLYRSWFEQSIESLRTEDPVKCINLSRSGSHIEGMTNLRMKDPQAKLDLDRNTNKNLRKELLEPFRSEISSPKDRRADQKAKLQEIQSLLLSLQKKEAGASAAETVWARYPELRALIRKTEVYISRNSEKLSDERADGVYRKNLGKSLEQYLRFSSRYL